MSTAQDDYNAEQALEAAQPNLDSVASAAVAAQTANKSAISAAHSQVALDLGTQTAFVGPDPTTGAITVLSPVAGASPPDYTAQVVQPASSLPGGVGQTPPAAPTS
jgi:hypothetical protein